MDITYKKINKDWESADSRFHYRKGDEVMVLKVNAIAATNSTPVMVLMIKFFIFVEG